MHPRVNVRDRLRNRSIFIKLLLPIVFIFPMKMCTRREIWRNHEIYAFEAFMLIMTVKNTLDPRKDNTVKKWIIARTLRNSWRGQERELTLEKIEIRPFNVDNHAIAIYIQSLPSRVFEQTLLLCKKNRWSHTYIYIYVRRRCIISNVSASKAYYYFLVPWREKGNVTRRNIEAGAYDDTLGARTRVVVAGFDILKADGRANHAIAGLPPTRKCRRAGWRR